MLSCARACLLCVACVPSASRHRHLACRLRCGTAGLGRPALGCTAATPKQAGFLCCPAYEARSMITHTRCWARNAYDVLLGTCCWDCCACYRPREFAADAEQARTPQPCTLSFPGARGRVGCPTLQGSLSVRSIPTLTPSVRTLRCAMLRSGALALGSSSFWSPRTLRRRFASSLRTAAETPK